LAVSKREQRARHRPAGQSAALAPRRLPILLALEVETSAVSARAGIHP